MHGGEGDCCVVVIGAGAGGALTASHLVTGLLALPGRARRPLPRHRPRHGVLDRRRPAPAQRPGQRHERVPPRPRALLPLGPPAPRPAGPAAGLRPPPRLRRLHRGPAAHGHRVPRQRPPRPSPGRVVGVDRRGDRLVVRLDDGTTNGATIVARAVVLATGAKAGTDWAPDELAASGRLLDPWTDELPDGDLLLVGTGLTMVDVAIAADRPGRTSCTRCRATTSCRPTTCCRPPRPCRRRPASPGCTTLDDLAVGRASRTSSGPSPRPATGGPPSTGCVPSPPSSGAGCPTTTGVPSSPTTRAPGTRAATGCLPSRPNVSTTSTTRAAGSATPARSSTATPTDDGVAVTLSDGTELTVAGVVNCTGPAGASAKDPLLAALTQTGLVRPGPSGLGIDTADDGRVLGVLPPTIPFYAIGTLRRGNLWETTAMPEIREQAYDVARSVARALHGETRRRPVDPYGLTLTTNRKAAPGVQPGARPAALPAGRRRVRASRRPSPPTPASPRPTPRWPCSATSGEPSARGARPSRPRTPRPPTVTSTTARSASSTP